MSAWESWIRPIVLIVAVALLGAAIYFHWIAPPIAVWLILLLTLFIMAGLIIARQYLLASERHRPWLYMVVVILLGLALLEPLRMMTPSASQFDYVNEQLGTTWEVTLPVHLKTPARLSLSVKPKGQSANLNVHRRYQTHQGPAEYIRAFSRQKGSQLTEHIIDWPVTPDLVGVGFSVTDGSIETGWRLSVEPGPVPWWIVAIIGFLTVVFAWILEVKTRVMGHVGVLIFSLFSMSFAMVLPVFYHHQAPLIGLLSALGIAIAIGVIGAELAMIFVMRPLKRSRTS